MANVSFHRGAEKSMTVVVENPRAGTLTQQCGSRTNLSIGRSDRAETLLANAMSPGLDIEAASSCIFAGSARTS
jgi:hypothetical protein